MLWTQNHGHPKVTDHADFRSIRLVLQQNVSGMDIPMDDPFGVNVLETRTDL